jgi:hypothetical protein
MGNDLFWKICLQQISGSVAEFIAAHYLEGLQQPSQNDYSGVFLACFPYFEK